VTAAAQFHAIAPKFIDAYELGATNGSTDASA
jgi:hypothetical protein